MDKALIRKKMESSLKWGANPYERNLKDLIDFGIIVLDKPQGPSSHDVSDTVNKVLGVEKAGHSGTLDPNVTGILVIGLNKATKILQSLLVSGKEYICLMKVHSDIDEETAKKILASFVGKNKQLPPVKSAVKREVRERDIYSIDFIEHDTRDILFKVNCQAGTYIRRICDDFGKKLSTGAHMQELRRTRVANFTEDSNMATLHSLSEAKFLYDTKGDESLLRKYIHPIEEAVESLKKIWVMDSAVSAITYGASIKVPGIAKVSEGIEKEETIAIMTLRNELIALATAKMESADIVKSDHGIAAVLKRVVMNKGIYPKMWKKA